MSRIQFKDQKSNVGSVDVVIGWDRTSGFFLNIIKDRDVLSPMYMSIQDSLDCSLDHLQEVLNRYEIDLCPEGIDAVNHPGCIHREPNDEYSLAHRLIKARNVYLMWGIS